MKDPVTGEKKQEEEKNVYSDEKREKLLKKGQIEAKEDAFMRGYKKSIPYESEEEKVEEEKTKE